VSGVGIYSHSPFVLTRSIWKHLSTPQILLGTCVDRLLQTHGSRDPNTLEPSNRKQDYFTDFNLRKTLLKECLSLENNGKINIKRNSTDTSKMVYVFIHSVVTRPARKAL
jgi:hypothetical protein